MYPSADASTPLKNNIIPEGVKNVALESFDAEIEESPSETHADWKHMTTSVEAALSLFFMMNTKIG